MRNRAAPVSGLVLVLLLAGCASDEAPVVARPEPTATFTAGDVRVLIPGAPGEEAEEVAPGESGSYANPDAYRETDVVFLTNMVPHHSQALRMAELAPERAQDEQVLALAERIVLAQGPEVATMQAWLEAQGLPAADPDAGHDSHEQMRGMATPEEMFRLESASGAEFDRLFLQMMTKHHEGAIAMAEQAVGAQHPIVDGMVSDTIASQGAEIGRMAELLDRLG